VSGVHVANSPPVLEPPSLDVSVTELDVSLPWDVLVSTMPLSSVTELVALVVVALVLLVDVSPVALVVDVVTVVPAVFVEVS
jgi:hypothetical protein